VLNEARQNGKTATSDAQCDLCSSPHDAFDLMISVVGLVNEYCEVRDANNTCSAGTANYCQRISEPDRPTFRIIGRTGLQLQRPKKLGLCVSR
jgi:hypothetical protein